MILPLDIALLFFLVVIGVASLTVKDLLAAIILLGAYSFVMATVWVQMHSPDVGFTEAVVGAGASTALMIAALSRIERWSSD